MIIEDDILKIFNLLWIFILVIIEFFNF